MLYGVEYFIQCILGGIHMFIILLIDSVNISSSCFRFHFIEAPGKSNLLTII